MAQLRSVNTKFWDDPWIESLSVHEKLLFLYLITCKYANLAGIYEITIKRISFETGIDQGTVSNGLKRFTNDKKAFFVHENYIVLPNWLKNQNLNANMRKGVVKIISDLPNDVKHSILGNHYQTIQNDYQMVLNTLLKYEVEVLEVEDEIECEEPEIFNFRKSLLDLGIEKQVLSDWLKVRSKKKAANTETAFNKIKNQIEKSGLTANKCIKIAAEKSWAGFESEWLKNISNEKNQRNITPKRDYSIRT